MVNKHHPVIVKNGPFVCCELNKARQSTCTLVLAHPSDWHSRREEIFDIHFTKPVRALCNRSLNWGVAVTLHIAKSCSMWSMSEWSVCLWSQWHILQTETWPPSPRWPTSWNRKCAFTDSPHRHIGHWSWLPALRAVTDNSEPMGLAAQVSCPPISFLEWTSMQMRNNWVTCDLKSLLIIAQQGVSVLVLLFRRRTFPFCSS